MSHEICRYHQGWQRLNPTNVFVLGKEYPLIYKITYGYKIWLLYKALFTWFRTQLLCLYFLWLVTDSCTLSNIWIKHIVCCQMLCGSQTVLYLIYSRIFNFRIGISIQIALTICHYVYLSVCFYIYHKVRVL